MQTSGTGNWRGLHVVVAIVIVVVVAVNVPWGRLFGGPERSVASYCQTWKEEGRKLHERWRAQQTGDNPFDSIATVMASPKDLADFFDKLDKVAPEEIEPDVRRYKEAWQQTADNLGGKANDPLNFLIAQMSVAAQTAGTERRIDAWTSTHCTTND